MAVEDLTTWTESDPTNRLSETATTLTINSLERDKDATWLRYDFGSGYWNGDFHYRFTYTVGTSATNQVGCWIYPITLCNTLDEPGDLEAASADFQSLIFSVGAGPVAYIYLEAVENGTRHNSIPDPISFETTYYIDFERDDDAGVNGTGQLTLRIYTGNYYGLMGAVEHDTVTLDCGASEQNDFQYVMLSAARGSGGSQIATGSLANLDLNVLPINYVDISGTTAGTGSLTGTLDVGTGLVGTISATATVTGFLTYGPLTGAKAEKYKQYLVAFGNDSVSFES